LSVKYGLWRKRKLYVDSDLKHWLVSSNEDLLMKTMSSNDYQDIKQQSNDSKSALHIGIASQDHRERTNKWQYSPLLRFFVHMMLITDEKLSIGIFDQTDG